ELTLVSETPAQGLVERALPGGHLPDQVDVEHELPEPGFHAGGEASQLFDHQPAPLGAQPSVGVDPVADVPLVADRVEEGVGPAPAGGWISEAGLPVGGVAAGLTGPQPALAVEQIWEDLAGLLRVEEPYVQRGRRYEHGGLAAVDTHFGPAGGMPETET